MAAAHSYKCDFAVTLSQQHCESWRAQRSWMPFILAITKMG